MGAELAPGLSVPVDEADSRLERELDEWEDVGRATAIDSGDRGVLTGSACRSRRRERYKPYHSRGLPSGILSITSVASTRSTG